MMMEKPIVLTIAGSDPSGGAGIQADIRAFEATGVYGLSVITAITVQTAEKVIRWEPVSPQLVRDQLWTLLSEYPIQYVKCGMIPTPEIVDIIVDAKKQFNFSLIVDPILISSSGLALVTPEAETHFKTALFPHVDILLPNAQESMKFTGIQITKMQDVVSAGDKLREMGIKNVIFKGGHIDPSGEQVVDYLYEDGGVEIFTRERVQQNTATHGTGCIFSAIFTAQLALTQDIYEALYNTEQQLERDFRHLEFLPKKENNVQSARAIIDVGVSPKQRDALGEVVMVYNYLRSKPDFAHLIPEVRMNISICIDGAKTVEDVAAVEGRISVVNNLPSAAGPIKMGVSNHTARLILTAHARDPSIHAVVNIKYIPWMIKQLAEEGLFLFEIRREQQPDTVRSAEQNSMQWIIGQAYSIINKIPDIIWDCGEPEKEPMIRLFALNGKELIEKLEIVLRVFQKYKTGQ